MKKNLLTAALVLAVFPALAQSQTAEEYMKRYENLVSRVGTSGLGVETLLDKWEADWPEDLDMLQARFLFCFDKSQSVQMVAREQARFLGQEPTLALKDSLGKDVNYFQETFYDDELFGQGIRYIEKAIQLAPERLDLRFNKVAALVGYEKESPDMALSDLKSLIDYNASQKPKWQYPGITVDKDYFDAAIQEYCFVFFKYATPRCYDAFRDLSQKMLDYEPNNTLFLDNLGSYYLVAKRDDKNALKYYNKVLKIKKEDITAIRNCVLLARNSKDTKLEKKYLPMLAQYAETETDKAAARARLEFLSGKKK